MTLDVSEAIALAKDLLQTSGDYRAHDPELAASFSERAYEICDDLGIDRALIDQGITESMADETVTTEASVTKTIDDDASKPNATATVEFDDDEARQTSQQLRDLLQQQAQVLENVRETEAAKPKKIRKRSFRLFGRSSNGGMGQLQTA